MQSPTMEVFQLKDFPYFYLNFTICIILLASILYFYKVYTHCNEIPTPPFVPIIGHILNYRDPYKALQILTQDLIKYGGIIRQYIGPQKPGLIIANKEILEFLCRNSKYVCKAKYYEFLKPWLGEGLITSDGEKWKARRKALTAKFIHTSSLISFIEIFDKKTDVLISVLEEFDAKIINLNPIMKRFTFDVICETAMGISLNPQTKTTNTKYAESVETLCEVALNRMTSFLMSIDFFYQFTKDCLREKTALAVIDAMLNKIIELKLEKRSSLDDETRTKDFLDLLMEVEINGVPLSRNDIREEINTFIFAGYDTSSTAMSLTLYEIAKNSNIQDKLFQEQKKIFQDFDKVDITYEKLQEMSYLEAVIKESLRFHTIVPAVGKRIIKDLKYGDVRLPAMINFMILIHALHHNPKYFSNPEKFEPERFADQDNIADLTYMPFGMKPRQCLGKNFAMLEMKCALSKVIRNFEINTIPEHQLKIKPKLVLFSATGIWVEIKKRIM